VGPRDNLGGGGVFFPWLVSLWGAAIVNAVGHFLSSLDAGHLEVTGFDGFF